MPYRMTMSDPEFSLLTDGIEHACAEYAKSKSLADQAAWDAEMARLFNGTNASGLDADTRALLAGVFTRAMQVQS